MSTGVYCIRNKVNGRMYEGVTVPTRGALHPQGKAPHPCHA
jgi:hypothetical protein